ncbi:MAG: EAL domain-containing protein [Anaerosomatales bacterium]|nr:EAL domain-containing protein [Anaerosomatales bacterium]
MAHHADTVLFDAAPLGLLAVEPATGAIVRVNTRAASLLRADPASLAGASVFDLFDPASREAVAALLSDTCSPDFPAAVTLADGRERELFLTCSRAVVEGRELAVIGIVSAADIASSGASSVHADRRAVLAALEEHVERAGRPAWLLFADIDRFRRVVDDVGHVEAERVLASVFQRIARALRGSDLIVRFGADEFLALLSDRTEEREAREAAQRVVDSSQEAFEAAGRHVQATLTVGIAQVENGVPIEEAVKRAEAAARAAKSGGPARWRVYDPDLAREIGRAEQLVGSLRAALERAEFVLHYQPVIDISRQAIVGAEALIRWDHPQRGLVMPGEFVAAAEESGLISDIGAWVIHEACRQMREWSSSGLESIWVSVNVSARQLRTGEVVGHLSAALADTGVEPERCVLEVTETALLEDPDVAYEVLEAVRAKGARVALDDFGTGYSSLSRMREMPFNELKIDRSFLQSVDVHARDAALVAAMVALAHSFQSTAIAEGVETQDQLSYLKALKCDMAQGYVFSRPLAPDAFVRLAVSGAGWIGG